MLTTDSIIEYFKSTITDGEQQRKLFATLYEITGDIKYFPGELSQYKLETKKLNKEEWENLIQRLGEDCNKLEIKDRTFVYQAYIVALLYLETPLSLTDIGKLMVIRDNGSNQMENVHIYSTNDGVILFDKEKKGVGDRYNLPLEIKEKVDIWLSTFNTSTSFIINHSWKRPSDVRNYISKQIFKEFGFPRIK